jgi:hypothetical protein
MGISECAILPGKLRRVSRSTARVAWPASDGSLDQPTQAFAGVLVDDDTILIGRPPVVA